MCVKVATVCRWVVESSNKRLSYR